MNKDLSCIKQQLDRETIIMILIFIGYPIDRRGMFKLREDKKTASASVRRDDYIKDFGSGWGGDIFALLQEHGTLSFPRAVECVTDELTLNKNTYKGLK